MIITWEDNSLSSLAWSPERKLTDYSLKYRSSKTSGKKDPGWCTIILDARKGTNKLSCRIFSSFKQKMYDAVQSVPLSIRFIRKMFIIIFLYCQFNFAKDNIWIKISGQTRKLFVLQHRVSVGVVDLIKSYPYPHSTWIENGFSLIK